MELPWKAKPAAADQPRAGRSGGHSVLDDTAVLEGHMAGTGSLEIHGRMQGDIMAGDIYIAPGGSLEGEVDVLRFRIAGHYVGRADADSVIIESTAEVEGTIHHHEIVVESGAKLKGLKPWRPTRKAEMA
ncbi:MULTISPECIES: polymer-forming cytoskeletal protein [Limibacillus]|jgi:cytoskeletal protein CcmA (bactofilin family)|uniref:Cytoskeletal protein CcmA (Bactofilin family) n=1 Tax=Limibacillus halophilus TaxID=1579333 RepID=A0A839SUT5_9PROT|nr:polymer-forming cytoskeletal protein [Limibacillus halophilus]MBB3065779.1 cytoskeletal protein CcmA (bactofilin family) [Limibacillus halophilus]